MKQDLTFFFHSPAIASLALSLPLSPLLHFKQMEYSQQQQQQPSVAWYDSGAAAGGASSYGGGAATSDARHRSSGATFAPPAPAFIPPQQPASFDSYDGAGGPSTTSSGYGGYGGYGGGDRGTTGPGGGFEDEPPLLEELGIDVAGIARRSVAVLRGRAAAAVGGAAGASSSTSSGDDGPDLGGPLLFAAALGATHLLASKLHFGVILGWTVVGSFACWVVAGNLAAAAAASSDPAASSSPPHGPSSSSSTAAAPLPPVARVGLYETTCLVGYGMLPLVLASAAALLLPAPPSGGDGGVGAPRALLVGGAALWSSRCASRLFAARWPVLRNSSGLVAYPCAMLYCALALLTLYPRNGNAVVGGGAGAATTPVAPLVPPPPALVPPPPVLTT